VFKHCKHVDGHLYIFRKSSIIFIVCEKFIFKLFECTECVMYVIEFGDRLEGKVVD